ncbi:MAG: CoA pyrophosphatase [Chloroflexi bacterium]|nr:CoA pyrophosphatase [Chloroflexota bacterium]
MSRILRAEGDWEEVVADALRRAARPIGYDERLLPLVPDGSVRPRRPPTAEAAARVRPAATLLAIYPGADGDLVVPLTVRRAHLSAHGGEISLPGGAVDAEDADPVAAALREAWEEVALEPDAVRVAGLLDQVWIPVSNFVLQPVVGTVASRPALTPHDAEVAAVVELPLAALFDPSIVAMEEFRSASGGWTIRAGAYRWGDLRVWGATALTLGMLARVLSNAEER